MKYSDIDEVIDIHKVAFKGFFLTRMGPEFLRAYYQAVMDFEKSIALVAHNTEQDALMGFVVGFQDPQGFYALFSHRKRRLLPVILQSIMRDPRLIIDVWRNTRRVTVQAQQLSDAVELSSIAVRTAGQGVGGVLLEAFATQARNDGAKRLVLTTDHKNNDAVQRFYEAHSFTLDGFEERGQRRLCRYGRALG